MKKIICILSLLIACLHIKAQQEINFDTLSAGFQFHHDYELPIITGGYYETQELAKRIVFYTKEPLIITGMGHRTKRILRIERKEYQTY